MKHNIEIDNVVFFDGVCNICNSGVDFLLRHSDSIKFASLQSDIAKRILPESYTDVNNLKSLVYINNGQLYTNATAVFKMASEINGLIKYILKVLSIVPTPLADFVYNLIAKNRYKLGGKRKKCRIPTKHEYERFL